MTWTLTADLEEAIITKLESGISLVKVCQQDGMPSRSTVLRWQRENPDFDAKCARAREAQGEVAADKLYDINDQVEQKLLDPAAARVISSNLQWMASKLFSKRYGEKIQQEIKAEVEVTDAATARSKLLGGAVPIAAGTGETKES